jgi:hypothetical protein
MTCRLLRSLAHREKRRCCSPQTAKTERTSPLNPAARLRHTTSHGRRPHSIALHVTHSVSAMLASLHSLTAAACGTIAALAPTLCCTNLLLAASPA